MFNRPKSFFTKQFIAVIGINFLTLGIASWLLYTTFVDDYRDNLIDIMQSKVNLISATSASALVFNDNLAADTILASLEQIPTIRFGQIYDTNMQQFADFKRPGQQIDVKLGTLKPGWFFKDDNFYQFSPIQMYGEVIGYLLISADTDSLQIRQQRYGRIVLWVFLLSLLLAYLLNWRMQKYLLAPISQLSNLVEFVAQQGLYHKRLKSTQQDEIGTLVTGVNSMLDTIEEHQRQLQGNSERLEGLVELRTAQLFNRANYDALTQLPNRHLFTDRLTHGIDNARRENTQLALMFLDLDRFKMINDSLGHSIGDALLIQVANRLTKAVRKNDTVGRWGGDEFVILLERTDNQQDIEKIAQQIIDEIAQPMLVTGRQLHISTSIGIACYPKDGEDAERLLTHADISMYQAKKRGPGRYCYFTFGMLDDSIQRLSLESQLRQAVHDQDFILLYQPKIDLVSEQIVGLEALIRWRQDDVFISPTVFLPVAEDVGLIHQISLWVLNDACQQNALWQQAGLPIVPVAINLPASFLMGANCIEHIQQALNHSGLNAQFLEVEITENTFMAATELVIDVLKRLHTLGVKVAIDDFGTGYSCLSYLKNLPVGTLKIDGTFIEDLGKNPGNDGIVQSIVTLGRSLGLDLVAECVEHQFQVDILANMGCHVIQGDHFSQPLTAIATAAYLNKAQGI